VRSGHDLFVEAEVFFNCGDADFELLAFVEIGRHVILDDGEIARVVIENLRVIGERGFHVGNIIFDGDDVFCHRGEAAVHLSFEISEAAFDGREDAVERCLTLLVRVLCGHMRGSIPRRSAGVREGYHAARKSEKRARILEARIMRTGCDVHHGFRERTDARGAGLSGRKGFGLGSHTGKAKAGGSPAYRRCVGELEIGRLTV
jgi:hypothetical protein